MKARSKMKQSSSHLQFDDLPNAAWVNQKTVEVLLSISGPTVWRRVNDGTIPKPKHISPGCTRWNVGELRGYLASL